jgi:ribA/ribD-fused uncharacterized protein
MVDQSTDKARDYEPITRFADDFAFLSNFWPCRVEFEGMTFPGVEQAFQAAKALDPVERRRFTELSPVAAKRLGRKVQLRRDWQEVKVDIMRRCLQSKFADPELRAKLLATGERQLAEGNRWGDRFWGVCRGSGQNMLGVLLMELRNEIRNQTV